MEGPCPSFQSLAQLHSSSSPGDNKKKQHLRLYKHLTTQRETMNNTISGVIGFTRPCLAMMFVIHSASRFTFQKEKKKINHLFTSSWIFFSFSFCSELETGFDLLPSKLMYKPPSSFILMPGSIRLDISFLEQIDKEKILQEEQSCLVSHLWTLSMTILNIYECGCSVFVASVEVLLNKLPIFFEKDQNNNNLNQLARTPSAAKP